MTATTIHRWLATIPDALLPKLFPSEELESFRSHGSEVATPQDDWDAQRFALVYRRPDFGWHFSKLLAEQELNFPGVVDEGDRVLFRSFCYHVNRNRYRNQSVTRALGLTHKSFQAQKAVVDSLLLSPDSTVEEVARHTQLDVETLRAYERLFFNVLDRKADALYIMRIVYPEGRVVEFMHNYLNQSSMEPMLRRVGHRDGVMHVLYQAGISNDLVDNLAASSSTQQMEDLLMANGYVMARAGLLNQEQAVVPGIFHAQRLLAAGKVGGEDTGSTSLPQLWGAAISDELRTYADSQLRGIQDAMTIDLPDLVEELLEAGHELSDQ